MITKDVRNLIDEGVSGVAKLYKLHQKYFDLIDEWGDKLTGGDLLDEYELSQCMERMTGCLSKLGSVAGALESLVIRVENDKFIKEEKSFTNIRIQDKDHCKAVGRHESSDLREYASDFRTYFVSADKTIITCQSRLKRLTVEKSAKGVDYTGDTNIENRGNKETSKWD